MSARGTPAAPVPVLLGVLGALLGVLLGGCQVLPQQRPVAVDLPSTTDPSVPGVDGGSQQVEVYLVRGDRLTPVVRRVRDSSAQTALSALVAGPTRAEVGSGLRTALPPQPLVVSDPRPPAGTAVVTATEELSGLSGRSQLLAVGQLVWTLTGADGVQRLRVVVGDRSVELPTDDGLSPEAVARADYASVAPLELLRPGAPAHPEPDRGGGR
ncbi:GerMN domain-containing protein [Quadrisphaera sp. DSM 44207]|uniref:GerMN domain-containing protein n=1 Tax=Quadrisphaera sp. DSM 44207 TaxID=1881057 RepID=UPI00088E62D9|nr:GerMN domain-containing protein [Quadrisphaera sp. DSM 44207]SDQ63477.1 Sporulation and spore germination [Quadrisphaera sp. DSM 44207]